MTKVSNRIWIFENIGKILIHYLFIEWNMNINLHHLHLHHHLHCFKRFPEYLKMFAIRILIKLLSELEFFLDFIFQNCLLNENIKTIKNKVKNIEYQIVFLNGFARDETPSLFSQATFWPLERILNTSSTIITDGSATR